MSELDKDELKATRELNKNKYKNAEIFGVENDEIEYVELNEDDITERYEVDIHVDCPKCGDVYDEYDISFEKDYICVCENCGHKFMFNYCPY